MNEKASCITINCGCCGNGGGGTTPTPVTGDGTPIGTVIAYMGTKAPMHYLACDGTVLKLEDFPLLAQQIQDEFGTVDYYGGDGTETFALPDLRNEFIRGYHGDAEEQLSGEVGEHQDPTMFPDVGGAPGNRMILSYTISGLVSQAEVVRNAENYLNRKRSGYITSETSTAAPDVLNGAGSYAGRPTNVAVLYCIKYE